MQWESAHRIASLLLPSAEILPTYGAGSADGDDVIDVRLRDDFAVAHIPGSVRTAEGGSFLGYVGWLLAFNAPVSLVVNDAAQPKRDTFDLFRIGFEDVRGFISWRTWSDLARPAESAECSGQSEVVFASGGAEDLLS